MLTAKIGTMAMDTQIALGGVDLRPYLRGLTLRCDAGGLTSIDLHLAPVPDLWQVEVGTIESCATFVTVDGHRFQVVEDRQ